MRTNRFQNGAETLSPLPCPILFRGDNAMSKDDFSQILSEFLRDNHLSQADFVQKVCVRSGQVNEWLKGRSKPGYDTLKKFVCAFEASAEYFVGKTEEYWRGVFRPPRLPFFQKRTTAQSQLSFRNFFKRLRPQTVNCKVPHKNRSARSIRRACPVR